MTLKEDWANGDTVNATDLNAIAATVNALDAGGATNLAATLTSTQTVITSDTGTDATIPAVDATNAGVMTPTQKTKLDAITGTNTGDQTSVTGNAGTATKLATARNINGVAFDGTANITVADATKEPAITSAATTTVFRGDKTFVTLTQDIVPDGTTNKAYTATEKTKLAGISGTNTGDQASIVGITGTKAQFNTAVSDGDIVYTDNAALTDTRTPTDNSVTNAKMADAAVGIAELSATGTPSSTTFLRGDNAWATPAGGGGGDASTNTATSVDSEVALFSSTTGKLLKRATGSGIAKLTSGVLGTATAGTDYYAPGSTDVAITDGGTGASTLPSGLLKGAGTSAITAATAGTDYVVPGGVLGTPSSGTLTSCTGLPVSGIAASTSTALGVGSIELGAATDTTISRTGAGAIAVEGVGVALNSTSLTHTASTIELGAATDTTLSRSAAGKLAVEGVDVVLLSGAQTLTGKTLTSPVVNTPTGIVKGDVGLGNVDNVSDANKPVSTAQASADGFIGRQVAGHKVPAARSTYFDKSATVNASLPSTLDTGQGVTYINNGVTNGNLAITAASGATPGQLTNTAAAAVAAGYAIGGTTAVRRVGIRHIYGSSGSTSGAGFCIALMNMSTISPSNTSWRVGAHLTIAKTYVQLQKATSATGSPVFTSLGIWPLSYALAEDGLTVYETEMWLTGSTLTVLLPDGQVQRVTDVDIASWSDSPFIEVTSNATTDHQGGITEFWYDTGTQYPPSAKLATSEDVAKRAKRVWTQSNNTSVTVDSGSYDVVDDSGITGAITVNAPTGNPSQFQSLLFCFTGTASRAITWNAVFADTTITRPTTTSGTAMLRVGFMWNSTSSHWDCVGVA